MKVLKWLYNFKESGFNLSRLKRMQAPMNFYPKNGLQCVECGEIYDYPHEEVEMCLTNEIDALDFCSRKCWNKNCLRKFK